MNPLVTPWQPPQNIRQIPFKWRTNSGEVNSLNRDILGKAVTQIKKTTCTELEKEKFTDHSKQKLIRESLQSGRIPVLNFLWIKANCRIFASSKKNLELTII